MRFQMTELSVHGHEELRPYEGMHKLELFLTCMSRHVYIGYIRIYHLGSLFKKPVHDVRDRELVSRNR